MVDEPIEYLSQEAFDRLKKELKDLKEQTITALAKRIDEARQMGDLSENAEYHAAREELAWAQSRIKEIDRVLGNARLMPAAGSAGHVSIGSTVTISAGGKTRVFTIVGAQEASPAQGKISNESPLGTALLGKSAGAAVELQTPGGNQRYDIVEIR